MQTMRSWPQEAGCSKPANHAGKAARQCIARAYRTGSSHGLTARVQALRFIAGVQALGRVRAMIGTIAFGI